MRAIEAQLQRLEGSHSTVLGPKGLYNRLGRLSRAILSGDGRPTETEYEVLEDLFSRIDEQLRQLDEVTEDGLPGVANVEVGERSSRPILVPLAQVFYLAWDRPGFSCLNPMEPRSRIPNNRTAATGRLSFSATGILVI